MRFKVFHIYSVSVLFIALLLLKPVAIYADCTPGEGVSECSGTPCGNGSTCATGHRYCVWSENGNYPGDCSIEVNNCGNCPGQTTPTPTCTNPQAHWDGSSCVCNNPPEKYTSRCTVTCGQGINIGRNCWGMDVLLGTFDAPTCTNDCPPASTTNPTQSPRPQVPPASSTNPNPQPPGSQRPTAPPTIPNPQSPRPQGPTASPTNPNPVPPTTTNPQNPGGRDNAPVPDPSCSSVELQTISPAPDSTSFRVYARGVANAVKVYFPVWTVSAGPDDKGKKNNQGQPDAQGDMVWYEGKDAGGGSWYADLDMSKHSDPGQIAVHVYPENRNGKRVLCSSTSFTKSAAPAGKDPIGRLDGVSCTGFTGWAGDPDDPAKPIEVKFYADGPVGSGKLIGTATANAGRGKAVCDNLGGGLTKDGQCLHGFVFTAPATLPDGGKLQDGKPHQIFLYGANLAGTGGNDALLDAPKSINCSPAPVSTPTPTTAPEITKYYRIDEDATFTKAPDWVAFNPAAVKISYRFKDDSLGDKYLYIQFKSDKERLSAVYTFTIHRVVELFPATPTPTPTATPTSAPTPTPTPTPTLAPSSQTGSRPALCQSAAISGSTLNKDGSLTITSIADPAKITNVKEFWYAFYNRDNPYSNNGTPQPILVNGSNLIKKEIPATSTNTFTTAIPYSFVNQPDGNWNNQKPKNIQVNAYFLDQSGNLSAADGKCVVSFTVADAPITTNNVKTCSVRLSANGMGTTTAVATGQGNLADWEPLRLWVESDTKGAINPAPSTPREYGGIIYYQLGQCNTNNTTPCSITQSVSLPGGNYHFSCDLMGLPGKGDGKCSGNPFCNGLGEIGGTDCSGWSKCSDNDSAAL